MHGPGGSSRMVPARKPRATWPCDDGARADGHVLTVPIWPEAVDRRALRKQGRLKRYVHRGRCGADLKNTARGTPRDGGLAAMTDSTSLDVARRRGPWV